MGANEFKQLEAKLLGLGGDRVVPMADPPPAILLARGRVFETVGRRRVRGRHHDGDANVALHYLQHHHLGRGGSCDIVAGYGLHGRLWLPHAWGWDGAYVLETRGGFAAYYGFTLDADEASRFVMRAVARLLPSGPSFWSNF